MSKQSIRSALVLFATLAAAPAFAQDNFALVADPTQFSIFTNIPDDQKFESLEEAIIAANDMSLDIDTIQILAKLDDGAVWTPDSMVGGFPAIMEPLVIEGLDFPEAIVIDGSDIGIPVFTILSNDVEIKSVTLTGGSYGVDIQSGPDIIINRCYIRDNADGGILVSDMAEAPITIANSSIVDNGGPGVRVQDGVMGQVHILLSTFLDNLGSSILGEANTELLVEHTLIGGTPPDNIDTGIESSGIVNFDFINIFGANVDTAGGGMFSTGNLTVFLPIFVEPDPDWKGQLDAGSLAVNFPALGDKGTLTAIPGVTDLDFDGNTRPFNSGFDIGADEIGIGINVPAWIEATVFPNPVGKLGAGEMTVTVRVTNVEILDGIFNKLMIVPQSADIPIPVGNLQLVPVTSDDFFIPLDMTRVGQVFSWPRSFARPEDP